MSTFLSRSFSPNISKFLESMDQTDVALEISDLSLHISQYSSSSLLNTLLLKRVREGRRGGGGRERERERERERGREGGRELLAKTIKVINSTDVLHSMKPQHI